MNTGSDQEAKNPEQGQEEVDLKEKLKEFIDKLSFGEQKILREAKWEKTNKNWEEGFLEFVEKDVRRAGNFGKTMFKDYVKSLRRDYEDTSSGEDPENKNLYKVQLQIAEKMLGLYTSEKDPEAQKKKNKEKKESIYGLANIKFTIAHIRKQILGLLGVNDPWWTEEHEQKRQVLLGVAPEKKDSKSGTALSSPAKNDNDMSGSTVSQKTPEAPTSEPPAPEAPPEEKKAA